MEAFSQYFSDELNMLSKKLQKDIQIEDIWSVSYKKVIITHHTITDQQV